LFGHKNSRRHGRPVVVVVVVVCFLLTGGEPPTQSRLRFQSNAIGKAKLLKMLKSIDFFNFGGKPGVWRLKCSRNHKHR
jgi:hypothetical protein